jgi:hypothetical protein
MKKSLVITTLLITTFAFVVSVSAGGKGSVKAEFSPNVGWVILNPTASGKINATAHLENGLPNENFTISVRVRYEDGSIGIFPDVATLSTNGQGQGNINVQVDIDPPAGSGTLRRVAFRVRRPGPPNIVYVAVVWDMFLKGATTTEDTSVPRESP